MSPGGRTRPVSEVASSMATRAPCGPTKHPCGPTKPPCSSAKPPSRPVKSPCHPTLRKISSAKPDINNNKVNLPRKVLVSQKIPKNFIRPQTVSSLSGFPKVPPIRALRSSTLSVRSERQGKFKSDLSRVYVDHCGDGPCQRSTQRSIKSSSIEAMRIKSESSDVSFKQASTSEECTLVASTSSGPADPESLRPRARQASDHPCSSCTAHDTEKSPETSEDEEAVIRDLKNFREENYFETHSCKTQPATSLENHKCSYSFYLNERLFVKPVRTDHLNSIRCDECALPIELGGQLPGEGARRGAIQAKVRLGAPGASGDVTVLVPVAEALLVRQWRRVPDAAEALRDPVYVGVLELGGPGGVGGRRRPQPPADSLALRYQRGYRRLQHTQSLQLKGVCSEDVIIV